VTGAFDELAGRAFDVIVAGGGINGAGIALEAQRAGYRTLLVEREDFGAGTTSRATRLIHGGLRYLEHAELGLVYESLGEREALLRDMPHLVRPLELLLPVYDGDERAPWKVRAGLALYDALSFNKSLPRHRAVPLPELRRMVPALSRSGLRAAYAFHDAQVEFPERIVIETVRAFEHAGGTALNHVAAARLVSPGGKLRAAVLRDACAGNEVEVPAPIVVNAAGPWVDELLRGSDAERHTPLIGGTKGSHIVVDWPRAAQPAIFAAARSDGRPFFVLPWYRYTLIGTTDLRYDGDPSNAQATPQEVEYLLDETRRLFPDTAPQASDVLYTYCGVRPLPHSDAGDEAAITRRHFIVDHVKRGGPEGLLSVVGGKLTNFRALSRMAVAAIRRRRPPHDDAPPVERHMPPARANGPLRIYGQRANDVQALADADPSLREPVCEHNPEMLAQAAYAVARERARTLGDVLLRRLPCGWSACHALDGAERVAAVIGPMLDWDDATRSRQIEEYRAEVRRTLVSMGDVYRR
jgi:glycerol-3-phosphate dehydrogenase